MSKTLFLLVLAAAVVVGAGCASSNVPTGQLDDDLHGAMLSSYRIDQAEAAVVREHAVYPHHFTSGSSVLNDLGERDVSILAAHLARYGGIVTVRRGDASGDLHTARLSTVIRALQAAGLQADELAITDGVPGGAGMASRTVIEILDAPSGNLGYDGGLDLIEVQP